MRKRLLEVVFAVNLFVWGAYFGGAMEQELYGIGIGILGVLVIDILDYLVTERKFLRLYWDCYKPWVNPEIRLSISYLYRIELNGKYLLVKSNRVANTYQPVGGVYKYYYPEAKGELDCMGAVTDTHIDNDEDSEYDLRLNLQNRKKFRKFLKWFQKGEKREIDPWREFYEELVITDILPADTFPYIHYELVGQHFEPIHRDKFFKVDTFKYADIYIPKFLNDKQTAAFKGLMAVNSSEYIWVTEQEIAQGKTATHHLIAGHTYKIFHNQKLHE